MSLLSLPSTRSAPQRVVTLKAELPKPSFFKDKARDGLRVLDMHVVVTPVGYQPQDTPYGLTNMAAVPEDYNGSFACSGVDTVPYIDSMRTHPGDRAFAVAVSGLVPVAVPGDVLATVVVGDWLFVRTTPSATGFSSNHKGVTFEAMTPTIGASSGELLGTIMALSPAQNYCLVLLHL